MARTANVCRGETGVVAGESLPPPHSNSSINLGAVLGEAWDVLVTPYEFCRNRSGVWRLGSGYQRIFTSPPVRMSARLSRGCQKQPQMVTVWNGCGNKTLIPDRPSSWTPGGGSARTAMHAFRRATLAVAGE
jgi:hypothetical protein